MICLSLREDTDFAKRVRSVFDAMQQNGVMIEALGNEFRITDIRRDDSRFKQMRIYNTELSKALKALPPIVEHKLVTIGL